MRILKEFNLFRMNTCISADSKGVRTSPELRSAGTSERKYGALRYPHQGVFVPLGARGKQGNPSTLRAGRRESDSIYTGKNSRKSSIG